MEKSTLQTTVKELEEFLQSHYRKTGERPSLNEALDLMAKNHMLSASQHADASDGRVQHSAEEICALINDQSVDATAFFQNTEKTETGFLFREDALFPAGRDVTVTRLFPFLSGDTVEYDCFTVVILLKGTCELVFGDAPLSLSTGGIVILPPHTPHTVNAAPDAYAAAVHMRSSTFDAQFGGLMTGTDVMSVFFRESLYGAGEPNYLQMTARFELPDTLTLLYSLVRECTAKTPLANLCAICWLKLFLVCVYRSHSESVTVLRSARDEATRADCGAILSYIQQNYRTVRLSTLAKTFHYNETYLSRMLQNYMGMSFTDIVRGIKMTRAEEYLTNSNLRVHEISDLIGYDSVDHFSRTFKATHDMSPQAYRRAAVRRGQRAAAELDD